MRGGAKDINFLTSKSSTTMAKTTASKIYYTSMHEFSELIL